jgi:asparagine synthase (glutamine-hydrolysing)
VATHVEADSYKVSIGPNDLFNDFDVLISRLGEPFLSTSIYAQYRIFQMVRQAGVVVTLEGQGADEMLAGYNGYIQVRFLSLLKKGKWFQALKVLKNASSSTLWPGRSLHGTIKRLARMIIPPRLKNLARAVEVGGLTRNWLNQKSVRDRKLFEWNNQPPNLPANKDLLRRYLVGQLTWAGLPGLLRHSDRNSMTFSIESRVPFCNRELSSFLLSLPEHYLVSDEGLTKAVFRKAMSLIVPSQILDRRDKIGFETPEKDWFLKHPKWIEESFHLSIDSKLLNLKGIVNEWILIKEGKHRFDWRVWRWLNYLRWKELFNISE